MRSNEGRSQTCGQSRRRLCLKVPAPRLPGGPGRRRICLPRSKAPGSIDYSKDPPPPPPPLIRQRRSHLRQQFKFFSAKFIMWGEVKEMVQGGRKGSGRDDDQAFYDWVYSAKAMKIAGDVVAAPSDLERCAVL